MATDISVDHGGGTPLGSTDLTYSMATFAGMYIVEHSLPWDLHFQRRIASFNW